MHPSAIRVDTATHARLLEISKASGASLGETVRDAADALHRQRFAEDVVKHLSALHDDPAAGKDYLVEAEETPVADGTGR